METSEVISVIDSSGKKVDLELIDTIRFDGNEYLIVSAPNSNEAYAYKTTTTASGEKEYSCLKEGDEFRKVLQKYNEGN